MKALQIKFTGPSVVERILTEDDLKPHGVVFPKGGFRWNRENSHTVTMPADQLHETALEWFKKGSDKDEFSVKEIDVPDDFFGAPAVNADEG
jgi:hypothetical protein